MIRHFIKFSGLFLITAASISAQEFRKIEEKVILRSPALDEASGIAVSGRDDRFLWLINDSGAGPVIHLCGTDGTPRGTVTLTGISNIDWEDIATFTWEGKPWLLIADTGDNSSKRTDCALYLLPEPELPMAGKSLNLTVASAFTLKVNFADGPRDCESVAVDSISGKILLISKRTSPPMVYELPLSKNGGTAKRIAAISVEQPASFLPRPFASQPTGMDLSADGSLATVVTYAGVFIFPRSPQETWATAFAKKPVILAPHGLPQAEAVAFSKDGKNVYVTSEGKTPRLIRYQKE